MVEIELDRRIFLKSDAFCWFLAEEEKGRKGHFKAISYHSTLESALRGYIEHRLKKSKATSIKSLREEIKSLGETLRGLKLPQIVITVKEDGDEG